MRYETIIEELANTYVKMIDNSTDLASVYDSLVNLAISARGGRQELPSQLRVEQDVAARLSEMENEGVIKEGYKSGITEKIERMQKDYCPGMG